MVNGAREMVSLSGRPLQEALRWFSEFIKQCELLPIHHFVFTISHSPFPIHLYAMHRIEQVFSLRVNANAKLFTLAPHLFFQFGSTLSAP